MIGAVFVYNLYPYRPRENRKDAEMAEIATTAEEVKPLKNGEDAPKE